MESVLPANCSKMTFTPEMSLSTVNMPKNTIIQRRPETRNKGTIFVIAKGASIGSISEPDI